MEPFLCKVHKGLADRNFLDLLREQVGGRIDDIDHPLPIEESGLPAEHIVEIELQGDLRPSLVHGTEQGIDNRLRVLVADVDILVLHPARLVVDDADLSRAQAVHPVHVPDETKPVDLPLELFLQPKDLEAVRSG